MRWAPMYVEIPAGKLDQGETSLQTARRELVEETGYRPRGWAFLTRIHPAIGFSDEIMDLYLAKDLVLRRVVAWTSTSSWTSNGSRSAG